MLFIGLMFFLFMRQLQSGGGKAMSFGKAKARMLSDSQNKVTFADVAGIEEAKDEVEEIIAFLKDPKKFQRLGGRIPKGVLPGDRPAGHRQDASSRAPSRARPALPFFSISGSDFVEMFVGVGASRVRDLFEQGKKHAPCIIFIDEIDAVGRHRGAGMGGGHDEREQTLNQLLVEMDGFESNEGVIIIAATNRPDVLDPALVRPGRFDRRITGHAPRRARPRGDSPRPREAHAALRRTSTWRRSPAARRASRAPTSRNLVNEAALLAARQDKDALAMADFEMAKDKVYMGTERRSMVISDEEKRHTAIHEAGHALISVLITHHDPVHKVTIIPRGPALGVTWYLPKDDRYNLSKEQAESSIAVALGGRIAEEIIFGHMTTGAGNDIEKATDIARKMVCEWGMSEKLGPLTYGKKEEQVFLGRDYGSRAHKTTRSNTAVEIDQEVRGIVHRQYVKVKELLSEKREKLEALANALIERETLDAEEIRAVLEGKEMPKRERVIIPTYAEKDKQAKEKRKVASIFGGPPKPAPTGS